MIPPPNACLLQGDEEYHEHLRNLLVQQTVFPQQVAIILTLLAPTRQAPMCTAHMSCQQLLPALGCRPQTPCALRPPANLPQLIN